MDATILFMYQNYYIINLKKKKVCMNIIYLYIAYWYIKSNIKFENHQVYIINK